MRSNWWRLFSIRKGWIRCPSRDSTRPCYSSPSSMTSPCTSAPKLHVCRRLPPLPQNHQQNRSGNPTTRSARTSNLGWQLGNEVQRPKVLHPENCSSYKKPFTHMYSLCDHILEQVKTNPYLGVLLSEDLKWSSHINNIAGKLNQTLGFLRRNLFKAMPKTTQGVSLHRTS